MPDLSTSAERPTAEPQTGGVHRRGRGDHARGVPAQGRHGAQGPPRQELRHLQGAGSLPPRQHPTHITQHTTHNNHLLAKNCGIFKEQVHPSTHTPTHSLSLSLKDTHTHTHTTIDPRGVAGAQGPPRQELRHLQGAGPPPYRQHPTPNTQQKNTQHPTPNTQHPPPRQELRHL